MQCLVLYDNVVQWLGARFKGVSNICVEITEGADFAGVL